MTRRKGKDDDLVGIWSAMLRLHAALVPVIDTELAKATGTPLGWYDVLLELNAAPDQRMTMTELGAAAVLSRSRVSRVVDELEAVGCVRRVQNPGDRRSSYAELTEQGRTVFRRAAPVYLDLIRAHLGALLGADEAAGLRTTLERALAKLDAVPAEPLTQPGRPMRR
ncbi:MarR family winged helix-turn-helix transcriptional regulator [Mycobacterium sp. M26]|uniref:MarR family winged helix-turn-helix transcriptional regulator n=1 Tax=Mycobacterium sp. M26 TaxID=1762962 RepID=UPI000AF7BF2C|nr:MarR family winged helix-turn-helix transcriptional regulator [Mycobacterium sp. M26]